MAQDEWEHEDKSIGELFAEHVESLDGLTVGFRIHGTKAAADVADLSNLGDRIMFVVSEASELPHAGWVPVRVENTFGATLAFPVEVSAEAAVDGLDGPARLLRFEDTSEVTYPVHPRTEVEDWLPLGPRLTNLDAPTKEAIGVGVEPLLNAAQRLLDDLPTGDDAAELQALTDSTSAEIRGIHGPMPWPWNGRSRASVPSWRATPINPQPSLDCRPS